MLVIQEGVNYILFRQKYNSQMMSTANLVKVEVNGNKASNIFDVP